ncbi:MAG: mechanosensitive ion channel domain-containing protein [Planctomycetota bacterium]
MSKHPLLACLLLGLTCLGTTPNTRAQEPAEAVPAERLTPDRESLVRAIEELGDATAAPIAEQRKLYVTALEALDQARAEELRTEELLREIAQTDSLADEIRAELDAPTPPSSALPADIETRELEQRLREAESTLQASREELDQLRRTAERRSLRQAALPDEIARSRQAIEMLEESLRTLPPGVEDARRTARAAELALRRAELAHQEAERQHIDRRRDLLPLRRERAQRRVNFAEMRVEQLLDAVTRARERDAQRAAADAARQTREIVQRFPELADLARRNEEIARESTDLPARIEEVLRERDAMRRKHSEVERRFASTRRRVGLAGLTEGMGVVLRRDYEWLPSADLLAAEQQRRSSELSRVLMREIEISELRDKFATVTLEHEALLERLAPTRPTEEVSALARQLLETQRDLEVQALQSLGNLANALTEWRAAQDRLAVECNAYREYIAERILWVPSTSPNPLPSLISVPGDAIDVVADGGWTRIPPELLVGMRARLGTTLGFALALLVSLAVRRKLRALRSELAMQVRFHRTDRFRHTLRVVVQNLVLALPLPLVYFALAELLETAPTDIVRATGRAFGAIAPIALALGYARRVAQPKSLGEAHFRWAPRSMSQLRLELLWFAPTILIAVFVATIFRSLPQQNWNESLGRTGFLAAMVALAAFAYRLQRPGGALGPATSKTKKTILGRTHRLWSALAIGTPALLALLALTGYMYTAEQFELRVRASILVVMVLTLVHALLFRWLYMTRRRLAVEQARKKARARLESASTDGEEPPPLDEDSINIPAIDQQTQRLFKSGIAIAAFLALFFLWSSVLPALRALDRVQLYPSFQILSDDEQAQAPLSDMDTPAQAESNAPATPTAAIGIIRRGGAATAPNANLPTLPFENAVTLGDVLWSILLLVLTGTAAKNLPGLLEITILQRLPMDSGSRYAVATLLRYLIVIIGLTIAAGTVGLGWNKVQWLAAALTFGLAFGLQEIFANFVSGLIILIERPVRVGDYVTVGGVDGRVTLLRMRATTIQDWDRRELLVPNKEFITSTVINWSLSDPVTRLVVSVGIAYGSDTQLAYDKLLEAAQNEALILEEPAPQVVFRAFGESALDFELRIFIASRDNWAPITNKIHMRIDKLFREAGIEIPFPQRDLHIRSASALAPWVPNATDSTEA